jgi:hypothetical protein
MRPLPKSIESIDNDMGTCFADMNNRFVDGPTSYVVFLVRLRPAPCFPSGT